GPGPASPVECAATIWHYYHEAWSDVRAGRRTRRRLSARRRALRPLEWLRFAWWSLQPEQEQLSCRRAGRRTRRPTPGFGQQNRPLNEVCERRHGRDLDRRASGER